MAARKRPATIIRRYFNEWHERDLTDLIVRDRNHPSIFMWSIGNEVLEQWTDAKADTLSLEEANLVLNFGHSADMLAKDGEMSVNSLLTKKLADMVRKLDATRPVTAGCNEPNPTIICSVPVRLILSASITMTTGLQVFPRTSRQAVHRDGSVSGLMTRGYYQMPSDSMFIWPERLGQAFL